MGKGDIPAHMTHLYSRNKFRTPDLPPSNPTKKQVVRKLD